MQNPVRAAKARVKSSIPPGLRSALRQVREEARIRSLHRRGVEKARAYSGQTGLRLQLGCGPRVKKGWVNVDLAPGADLQLDLREPLPFDDGTFELIYAEHFVEHVDYPNTVGQLLKECYRVLEPGGRVSLVVPDCELVIRSYVLGGTKEFHEAEAKWHPESLTTAMEHINYSFRQGGEHRFAYDFETFAKVVSGAGFVDVKRREYDPELDSVDRIVGSLYVEGTKPDTPPV